MLTDEQIEILGDEYLVSLYQELEKYVIQDIARRVRKTDRFTETAEIMVKSMKEQGFSPAKIYNEVMKTLNADQEYRDLVAKNTYEYKQEIKKKIAEATEAAKKAGDEMTAEAAEMSFNDDMQMWQQVGDNLRKPNDLQQHVKAFQKQTAKAMKNITRSTAFKTAVLGTVPVKEAYQRALDVSLLKVATGNVSLRQACDDAVKELTKSGLRTINYDSGKAWQIDAAIRMSVRTGLSQMAGKIMESNCAQMGQDLVLISQHMGSRDTHADFQNKVFSLSGKSKKYPDIHAPLGEGCAYGRPEGLKGPNCTHNFYPYFEGITEIPPDLEEPEPINYNGYEYTRYEATQKMRSIERKIRSLKRKKYVVEDSTELNLINAKIKANKAEYMRFSKAMNLKPKENRLLVGGERSKWADTKKRIKINEEKITTDNFVGFSSDISSYYSGKRVQFKDRYILGRMFKNTASELLNGKRVQIEKKSLERILEKHGNEFNADEFMLIKNAIESPDYVASNIEHHENSILTYSLIPGRKKSVMECAIIQNGKNYVIHYHKIRYGKIEKLLKNGKIVYTKTDI